MKTKIVPATAYHALDLAYRLRPADLSEIKASSGFPPEEALAASMLTSSQTFAIVHKGRTEAIFGVAAWPMTPDVGAPWLLASPVFDRLGMTIGRNTIKHVRGFLRDFPILANYVDARHTTSIRWLLWAGFEITGIEPEYGVERRPFFRFSKVRTNV